MKCKHKIPTQRLISENQIFPSNSYMGIDFTIETRILNQVLGIFVRARLPIIYEYADLKAKMGIYNQNDNMCNKTNFEYKFDKDHRGPVGITNFIPCDKVKKYEVSGQITVGMEIIKCDMENNQFLLIQKMYQKICQEDTKSVIETLEENLENISEIVKKLENETKLKNLEVNKIKLQMLDILHENEEVKKEIKTQYMQIDYFGKQNESLLSEIRDLKVQLKISGDFMDINDFINLGEQEEEPVKDNIYLNTEKKKYKVKIMESDQLDLDQYSIYELRVMQNKFNKLQSKISRKINDEFTCTICYTDETDCIFVPCGHRCCCSECAKKCNMKCPMCRNGIDKVYKIY